MLNTLFVNISIFFIEKFTDVQREAIKRELDILKIVLSIRENVPIEMKDENHLTKAYELLKLIRGMFSNC